jgi:hypothetical protein
MRSTKGWETLSEVEERVKDEFCRVFLYELVDGTAPAVKSHFKRFEESKMSHDEYVNYVCTTATSLPPYQGIDMNEKFLLDLRLPKKYIDRLKIEIGKENKMNTTSETKHKSKKNPTSHLGLTEVQNTSDKDEKPVLSEVQNTSVEVLSEVQNTFDTGLSEVQNTSDNEAKSCDKQLIDDELTYNKNFHQRIIHNRRINNEKNIEIVFPQISNDMKTEKTDKVKVFSSSDLDESSYNDAMNENDKTDMALTPEQCENLANTIPEFLSKDKPRRKNVVKVSTDPDADERKVMAELAAAGSQIQNKAKKPEATIISNAGKLVSEFRKIIKEKIPSYNSVFSTEMDINDRRMAQMVVDKLMAREALEEDVLLEWMRFTVNANAKRKGFIGVSAMLSCLPDFEKYIPTPDSIAKRKKQKKAVAPKKKEIIGMSMENFFKEGLKPKSVIMSCQIWGIPMTAQYIASMKNDAESEKIVSDVIRHGSLSEIKGAFGVSVKYEESTFDLVLSNWKTAFSDLLVKVGKLDNFKSTDFDKTNAEEFVLRFGRRK